MIAVGFLGEYVGRIYEEGKGRPLYLVADAWNLAKDMNSAGMATSPRASTVLEPRD